MGIFRTLHPAQDARLAEHDVASASSACATASRPPAPPHGRDGGAHRLLPRAPALHRHRLRRRDEIARAVRALAGHVATGALDPEAICERAVGAALDTSALPDPDLIIRTSGEFRVSNFLLWQGVYAEFDFPPVAWPDFTVANFADSVSAYRLRNRRFGATDPAARPAVLAGE
jgi:hypothetical protein